MSVTKGSFSRWCALYALWLFAGDPAYAVIEVIGETRATFSWNAPDGPVAGYLVYVSRNGAPAQIHSTVFDGNDQTVHADFGDTIRVSTAAFDLQGNLGPRSLPSEKVRFVDSPSSTPLPKTPPEDPPVDDSPPPDDPPPPPPPDDPPQPPPYDGPAVEYDFDGDGHADILLRNTRTGALELWKMRGFEMIAAIELPTLDPGWQIAGTGHFDADKTADILWFDGVDRVLHIWFMGDLAADGNLDFTLGEGWVIEGVGDFDGDGRSEVAIWDQVSRIEFWSLSAESSLLGELSLRRGWAIAGVGDVDGDGRDDIVLQDGRKRRIEALLMSSDFSHRRTLLNKQRSPLWNVIDSADYDGNGQNDLLWRDVSAAGSGHAGIWHLASDLYLSGSPLALELGNDLSIAGSADYDGDGAADLLVFDPAERHLALFTIGAEGLGGFESLGMLGTRWQPTGYAVDDTAATR